MIDLSDFETKEAQADENLYVLLCGKPKANKIAKEISEFLEEEIL